MDLWATSGHATIRMSAYDGPGQGGPAVVAVHGLGTGIDVLRGVRPGLDPFALLAAEGFNVLAVDWPGHGGSGGRRGTLTYRAAMETVASAARAATERWGGPVGLFGTALGGVLGFYAALEGAGVAAVACHNVLDLRDVQPVLQRYRQGVLLPAAGRLQQWLPAARQARVRIPVGAIVATADLAEDPGLARALRRHPQAVRSYDLASLVTIFLSPQDKPDISAQGVPTFVAVGAEDRVLPATTTRAFTARLSCEYELWLLPGGGHQLLLEHPGALLPEVARFLHAKLGTKP
jgi:pimeloyl-ACP methyl ester carboxylesterase